MRLKVLKSLNQNMVIRNEEGSLYLQPNQRKLSFYLNNAQLDHFWLVFNKCLKLA
jgi:hypothetical protein